MISQTKFISYSFSDKYAYLSHILSMVETKSNKSLLLCQKLLSLIEQPSDKLLNYIFDVIHNQTKQYKKNEEDAMIIRMNRHTKLIQDAENKELWEEMDIDHILENI